ncbi:hypothetical protein D6764_00895 [Candidatus Woesearchaeota archaeon]|nr:MAG: hypothetical protein D6764_00895 [Candidatus Woesearchaeota archaeon]
MKFERLAEELNSRTRALEVLLVKNGLKRSARIATGNEKRFSALIEELGLYAEFSDYKVRMEFSGMYSTKGTLVGKEEAGHSFAYVALKKEDARLAKQLDAEQNIAGLGMTLGYPECCIEFFLKHREEELKNRNDYVLPSIENSKKGKHPFHLNIFARYFDFALISHAPHSLECSESMRIAKDSMNLLFKENPVLAMTYQKVMTGAGIYGPDFVLLLPQAKTETQNGKIIIVYDRVFCSPGNHHAGAVMRESNAALIERENGKTAIKVADKKIDVLAVEEFG